MGSQAERTHSKAASGGPSEVADGGAEWAKLQLAGKAAGGGPGDRQGDRPHNSELQHGEIKPQTSE